MVKNQPNKEQEQPVKVGVVPRTCGNCNTMRCERRLEGGPSKDCNFTPIHKHEDRRSTNDRRNLLDRRKPQKWGD